MNTLVIILYLLTLTLGQPQGAVSFVLSHLGKVSETGHSSILPWRAEKVGVRPLCKEHPFGAERPGNLPALEKNGKKAICPLPVCGLKASSSPTKQSNLTCLPFYNSIFLRTSEGLHPEAPD